jgi:mono/diheme cytochrome c family protein
MMHQLAPRPTQPISIGSGGYTPPTSPGSISSGGSTPDGGVVRPAVESTCRVSISAAALTPFEGDFEIAPSLLSTVVLPVDVALRADDVVIAAAGNGKTKELSRLVRISASRNPTGGCTTQSMFEPIVQPDGTPVAVDFTPSGVLVVQTREPAAVLVYPPDFGTPRVIALADDAREDTGHAIFHANAGGFIACASCHPEAGDDGRVWNFDGIGPRRTQNFRGSFLATAPFHWSGDVPDMQALCSTVLGQRMSGPDLDEGQLGALSRWLEAQPALPKPAPSDASAVERGRALFEGDLGCASCHAGARRTSAANQDVGTGASFQVPRLDGLFYRAPFMHDGCAATLAERFDPSCGGASHGMAPTPAQQVDLVAFLESL